MKLRMKLGRESRLITIEGRDSITTLQELKENVASIFNLNDQEFFLSLNKSDPLEGETLSDVGIVSGDMIHVIGPHISQENLMQATPQPLASYSDMSVDSSYSEEKMQDDVSAKMDTTVSLSQNHNQCDLYGNNESGLECTEDASQQEQLYLVNRCLKEPLVVRESTANQVPVLLEQLYTSVSCASLSDALWVVLHTLMLESGFTPHEVADITMMPPNWRQSGFYKSLYSLAGNTQVETCSLIGVGVGSSIVIHGLKSREDEVFKTEQLQLKASDYIRVLSPDAATTYRSLDRLSRHFKDTVCLPLYNAVLAAAGCSLRQGFEGLPYEIKMRILSMLDVTSLCRTGLTCLDLNQMSREKILWRRLFVQEFGKPDDCNLGRDWFELYKEAQRSKRLQDEERHRLERLFQPDPFWGFPGPGPFRPAPGAPFPPHFIGGDYDLNPEFAAGGNPVSGILGRRPVNPLSPDINLPSSFQANGGGIRIGGSAGRGNMTGSPFSTPFRGGPFM